MSIYVACRCGQAFSAEPYLAGQTLACPSCQQALTVPLANAQPALIPLVPMQPYPAGSPMGVGGQPVPVQHPSFGPASPHLLSPGHDPFAMQAGWGGQAMGPQVVQRPPLNDDESPLILWVSVIGGGLALCLVVGLLIFNVTRRQGGQPAASGDPAPTPLTAAMTPSGTTNAPSVMPAAPAFTPPAYGEMVTTADGKFEFWAPGKPSVKETQFQFPSGATVTHTEHTAGGKKLSHTFTVSVLNLPPGVVSPEEFFRDHLKLLGVPRDLPQRDVLFAGMNAKQHQSEVNQGRFRAKLKTIAFIDGGSGYTLMVTSGVASLEEEEFTAFFASFRRKS